MIFDYSKALIMNITKFKHYQNIGEWTVIFKITGYLSDNKSEFEISIIQSDWPKFDIDKVSDETKQLIIDKYLEIE